MSKKVPWRVRPAAQRDQKVLAAFRCADPAVSWQVEVEVFIQRDVLKWALDPLAADADPRLLLVFDRRSSELAGMAAHERQTLSGPGGSFPATKLEVVAVATTWQGRRFEEGTAGGPRVSDVVMSALMADVSERVPPRDARVFAVVHEDNVRSLALCRRYGLVQEMSRPDPSYRRLVTDHRPAGEARKS
jgi:hypothetical protein